MKVVVLYLSLVAAVSANPTVSNIRVAQRENTKLVDILYDVSFTGADTVTVSCEVSTNAGVSFDVPASSFSGDGYGVSVNTGADRLIVWDAGVDWNENYSDQMKVRITATPQRFFDNGDGTVLDTQTGLIWQKNNITFSTYQDTIATINALGTGWRIPTLSEYQELANAPTASGLPYGHYFQITSDIYWSSDVHSSKTITGVVQLKGFSFYQREFTVDIGSTQVYVGATYDFLPVIKSSELLSCLPVRSIY